MVRRIPEISASKSRPIILVRKLDVNISLDVYICWAVKRVRNGVLGNRKLTNKLVTRPGEKLRKSGYCYSHYWSSIFMYCVTALSISGACASNMDMKNLPCGHAPTNLHIFSGQQADHGARRLYSKCLAVLSLGLFAGVAVAQNPPPTDPGAFLRKYCVTCHNDRLKTAGLSLEKMDLARPSDGAEVWEKVIRKVRVGMMPPQGAPQPDAAARAGLVSWLETSLDRAAAEKPNPGRSLIHRLNRTEYANAIRDLLALEVDSTSLLPPDDAGYGFDNIADVLGVSPVLLERYVSAAGKISALAVGDPHTAPGSDTYRVRQDASQDVHIEGLPLGTIGGLLIKTTLPLDAEYTINVKFFTNNLGAMRGLEFPHTCETTVDGERVHAGHIRWRRRFQAASMTNITVAAEDVEKRCSAGAAEDEGRSAARSRWLSCARECH